MVLCSAEQYSFRRFQTCFKPLWDVHTFPYKCRITGYSCFPTVSNGFRPVSDLFGLSTNFHTTVGSADIAAFLRFQTFRPVSDLFGMSTNFHTNVGPADLAACLQFQTVSDLFGMSTNFHTNVGPADLAAFLQFQMVSDLFQTPLGCPQISIQM